MNILVLTQIIPYPPDAGPKVKTWHVLRYLNGLGHRVILAAFMRPEEEPFVPALREVCAEVHGAYPALTRGDVSSGCSHLTGHPFLIGAMTKLWSLVARNSQGGHRYHPRRPADMTQFAHSPPHPREKPG
jgi:hypothetical protein